MFYSDLVCCAVCDELWCVVVCCAVCDVVWSVVGEIILFDITFKTLRPPPPQKLYAICDLASHLISIKSSHHHHQTADDQDDLSIEPVLPAKLYRPLNDVAAFNSYLCSIGCNYTLEHDTM